jgi:hypothetical protein
LHDEQTAQDEDTQQTPSTQLPVEHWPADAQVDPWPSFWQSPPIQLKPLAVSHVVLAFAVVHAVAHAPAEQRNPVLQATGVPAVHAPAPLQVPLVLIAWCASAQLVLTGVHAVPFHDSQPPAPLHLPSVPQLVLAVTVQRLCGSAAPTPTARQFPSSVPEAFATLQAKQVPH